MAGDAPALLQFQPLESSVATSFWTQLAQSKLETLRLSEEPLDIAGAGPASSLFAARS
jgi:hypothetical protein